MVWLPTIGPQLPFCWWRVCQSPHHPSDLHQQFLTPIYLHLHPRSPHRILMEPAASPNNLRRVWFDGSVWVSSTPDNLVGCSYVGQVDSVIKSCRVSEKGAMIPDKLAWLFNPKYRLCQWTPMGSYSESATSYFQCCSSLAFLVW